MRLKPNVLAVFALTLCFSLIGIDSVSAEEGPAPSMKWGDTQLLTSVGNQLAPKSDIEGEFKTARILCSKAHADRQLNKKISLTKECLEELEILIARYPDAPMAQAIVADQPFLRVVTQQDHVFDEKMVDGQYSAKGVVNGETVDLLVNPELSEVLVPAEQVKQLGLVRGAKIKMPNLGSNYFYTTGLGEIQLGSIIFRDSHALIAPFGELDQIVIGYNLFEEITWRQDDGSLTLREIVETGQVLPDVNYSLLKNELASLLKRSEESATKLIKDAKTVLSQASSIEKIEEYAERLRLIENALKLVDQSIKDYPHTQSQIEPRAKIVEAKLVELRRVTREKREQVARVYCDSAQQYFEVAREAKTTGEIIENLEQSRGQRSSLLQSFDGTDIVKQLFKKTINCGMDDSKVSMELSAVGTYSMAVECVNNGKSAGEYSQRIAFYECGLDLLLDIGADYSESILANRIENGDAIDSVSKKIIKAEIEKEEEARRIFSEARALVSEAAGMAKFTKQYLLMIEVLEKIVEIELLDSTVDVADLAAIRETAEKIKAEAATKMPHEPELVTIPEGCFEMGSPASEKYAANDERQHSVCIDEFEIGTYEVTFKEYDRFSSASGAKSPDDRGFGRGNRPVINVSWIDAIEYAKWLSMQTDKNYRLPTEAEWEYVGRGGSEGRYSWGDQIGEDYANCLNCKSLWDGESTAEVGSFEPNGYGVYDMAGNVWEWTCSIYRKGYDDSELSCVTEIESGDRVIRGGSWRSDAKEIRPANRSFSTSVYQVSNYRGFRLVRARAE